MPNPSVSGGSTAEQKAGEFNACENAPLGMESFWVLVRRFLARNCLRPREFFLWFRRESRPGGGSTLDLDAFARAIELPVETVIASQPEYWEFGLSRTQRPLYFCPHCAAQGFHSVVHAVSWMRYCPIHGAALLKNCPVCNRHLGHTGDRQYGQSPATFPCGHRWTPVDVRYPPNVSNLEFVALAQWIKRLKSTNSEERWYALALDGIDCFGGDQYDFRELCDLVATWGGFPVDLRDAMRNRRFRKKPVFRVTTDALSSAWFSSLLSRLQREKVELRSIGGMAGLLCTDRLIHLCAAMRHLRLLSKARFVKLVLQKLSVLDLANRCERPGWVDEQWAEISAFAFLQKHIASDWWERHDDTDPITYLKRAMRLTGQPLGLLRIKHGRPEVFWSPLVWKPSHHESYGRIRMKHDERNCGS